MYPAESTQAWLVLCWGPCRWSPLHPLCSRDMHVVWGGRLTWSVLVQQINEWRYGNGRENCCFFIHFREELRQRRYKTALLLNTTHTHITPFSAAGFTFSWALAEEEAHHSQRWRVGAAEVWKCGSGLDLDIKAYLKNHFAPAFIQSLFLFTCMIFFF